MDKNNYFKNIAGKGGFIREHGQIIVFLLFAAFFFYIAMLSINISADMNILPGPEEVSKKFLTVKIKKDVIGEIDKLSAFKKEHLAKYLGNPMERNPFSPYEANSFQSSPEPSISPVVPAN